MGVKNFERLLISIPKCIELNSELILVLGLDLGSHPAPRPNIYFYLVKRLFTINNKIFLKITNPYLYILLLLKT